MTHDHELSPIVSSLSPNVDKNTEEKTYQKTKSIEVKQAADLVSELGCKDKLPSTQLG